MTKDNTWEELRKILTPNSISDSTHSFMNDCFQFDHCIILKNLKNYILKEINKAYKEGQFSKSIGGLANQIKNDTRTQTIEEIIKMVEGMKEDYKLPVSKEKAPIQLMKIGYEKAVDYFKQYLLSLTTKE